jgi:hypothetical protein
MVDRSREYVRNGFDPAMGVPREASKIIRWQVIAKVVQEEKWVEVGGCAEAERPTQVDACPFDCWLSLHEPLDRSNRHVLSLGLKEERGAWLPIVRRLPARTEPPRPAPE